MDFANKICLVTGGSRGIGSAIVKSLAEKGAVVYFTFVNLTEKKRKDSDQDKIYPVQCDVRDYESVKKMIGGIKSEHDRIDFVVNNAGISRDKPFALMPLKDWQDVIDTNLNGTFNVCRCSILEMIKKKAGRIINIASVSGITGNAGQSNYAASKAGIIGLSKSLAKEVASYGITVNVIAPGFVETDMVSHFSEKQREQALKMIPLKRFGISGEVASMVIYLLSDKADYITGEVIKIDGGIGI